MEELKALDDVTLASIGDTDMDFWHYDYQQVADQINEQLDRVQKEFDERFNFTR